ncbi:hypothetical protein H6P81_004123 [Aristolochia fimbriata]|uniref:DUF7780 domain-containing protein n=1 Tax=Aristolochia fimbriata TaxID=158543 RepID=A0AAV7FEJ0_ARIFI|nr:hypothetical protein H6P81_004123 [Aristolochia fimbriata]
MVLSAANGKTSKEGWVGLGGQLLVLFLHDDNNNGGAGTTADTYLQSTKLKHSVSSASTISGRAQSTISICAFLFFVTLLLFALSASDPSPASAAVRQVHIPRRWLAQKKPYASALAGAGSRSSFALQGMGTLFRRGNRAMSELVVAHVSEDSQSDHLRWFLRTLHRSGATARADVVFLFPQLTPQLKSVILQENEYFAKLLGRNSSNPAKVSSFNSTLFRNKPNGQPLWGGRGGDEEGGSEGLSWGSVVGFESGELDPEDTLAGFLDKVPIQLRRWACYRMLLGRVRRNFKHVMLIKVKDAVVTGDAFARIRNRKSGDTVWVADHVVLGGTRAARHLSDVVLTEIVRASMQRKGKTPHHDSQILSHLAKSNGSILSKKKVKATLSTDLVPPNSIIPFPPNHGIQQIICSSPADRSVYKDC